MGKVEFKKYSKAVWNSNTMEQRVKVCKLCEQQGIKLAMKQTSTDTRITALEAKLGITSQPEEGDVKKRRVGLLKNQSGGGTGEILQ